MYGRWSHIQKERNYVRWTNKVWTNDYSPCLRIVVHALDITQVFIGACFVLCEDNVLPHFSFSWSHWRQAKLLLSFQFVLLFLFFSVITILAWDHYRLSKWLSVEQSTSQVHFIAQAIHFKDARFMWCFCRSLEEFWMTLWHSWIFLSHGAFLYHLYKVNMDEMWILRSPGNVEDL